MQNNTTHPARECDTDEFGALNRVKAQSVRSQYCRTGSYFGIKPRRLANGRLLWPAQTVLADEASGVSK